MACRWKGGDARITGNWSRTRQFISHIMGELHRNRNHSQETKYEAWRDKTGCYRAAVVTIKRFTQVLHTTQLMGISLWPFHVKSHQSIIAARIESADNGHELLGSLLYTSR